MEAIDELAQLSDSMRQAAAVLADEDVDDNSRSSRRNSTFMNVVALGNTVSLLICIECLYNYFVRIYVNWFGLWVM